MQRNYLKIYSVIRTDNNRSKIRVICGQQLARLEVQQLLPDVANTTERSQASGVRVDKPSTYLFTIWAALTV